jgi:hypothetical protein
MDRYTRIFPIIRTYFDHISCKSVYISVIFINFILMLLYEAMNVFKSSQFLLSSLLLTVIKSGG